MPHGDHIAGAIGPGSVHGGLHSGVQRVAGVILGEAVDVVAVAVLEVGGGGAGEGLGGGHAHKGDLHAVELLDDVGLEHQFAFLGEVGADVGEISLLHQGQEVVHAVVELMVSGNGHVVAHGVHQVDDGFTLGHGANRFALDGVAVIHQHHMVAGGLEAIAHGGQAGVAEALINAAVSVAGEQDHHILLEGRRSFFSHGSAAQQQCQGQEQAKNLFHRLIPPFWL